MSILIPALLLIAVILLMIWVGMRQERGRDPLQERLADLGAREAPESLEEVELSINFRDRVLLPIVQKLADITARLTPQKQLESTRHMLELAGQNTDPVQVLLIRVVMTIVLGIAGILMGFVILQEQLQTALLYSAGGFALGYFLPVMLLRSQISRRQNSIVKALPDALDLLVICVEAGLGFDAAMSKVYEKWDNDLALAFGRVLREIQLGRQRRQALKDMADRMEVPDVNSFTAAIIQAEQLGVSMAKILRVQSDQMRTKRRQRAQEKAQQAPVKMMIPMVLLIFPSIWVVLLGPAVIQLMTTETGGIF